MCLVTGLNMSSKVIAVIAAHIEDVFLSMGGTIASYIDEGYDVRCYSLTYNDRSVPHYRRDLVKQRQMEEGEKAIKRLGVTKNIIFYDYSNTQLNEFRKQREISRTLTKELRSLQPEKVFTHASDDGRRSHRNVSVIVQRAVSVMAKKTQPEVYGFGLWRLFRRKTQIKPRFVVDVTTYMAAKMDSLSLLKQQQFKMVFFKIILFIGGFLKGLRYNSLFVEVFYKQ